jgi:collagenase-like PrtC family protease
MKIFSFSLLSNARQFYHILFDGIDAVIAGSSIIVKKVKKNFNKDKLRGI